MARTTPINPLFPADIGLSKTRTRNGNREKGDTNTKVALEFGDAMKAS